MAIRESKIKRCIKAPIRALSRVRNLYIRTRNNLVGQIHSSGGALSYPSAPLAVLPKSFSVNSASGRYQDGDIGELLRVASAKSLGNKIEVDSIRRQQSFPGKTTVGECKVIQVPPNQSITIGRIDEDHTCDFDDDVDIYVNKTEHVFPRSRSSAAVMNKY